MSSHTRGRRTVPDILAQPARCTQRDDQVGEAHALACGYPTALRWGYHGVRLPRAAHKAHPSPGRRRRTQVRLASPAERRGGFGTCGWRGAGRPKPVQPLVAADVMPARVHAVRVRDYDRLRRARFTTLAALRTCFGSRADPDSRTQGPSSTPP
jgi:hypothetical protein